MTVTYRAYPDSPADGGDEAVSVVDKESIECKIQG